MNGGKITAIAPGTAVITAKAEDKTARCTVTVQDLCTLDLNGFLDGKAAVNIDGYGTVDV